MAKNKKQEEKSDSLLYTQAVSKVEKIIEQIEGNELDLEDLLAKTKEACELLSFCKDKLYSVQNEVSELMRSAALPHSEPIDD